MGKLNTIRVRNRHVQIWNQIVKVMYLMFFRCVCYIVLQQLIYYGDLLLLTRLLDYSYYFFVHFGPQYEISVLVHQTSFCKKTVVASRHVGCFLRLPQCMSLVMDHLVFS